ncbi:hypothetical protein [Microbispora hainanensis]|uniref:hypothetical protein n=1 Tax=Microbispora hainanensis TaxID=568844 RepID=UPI001ABFB1FD|nr:hypothetical protein [Microbispora hainanensis]
MRPAGRASRSGSARSASGTVARAAPSSVTTPAHPGGHNHDSGETTTATSPGPGNATGTRAIAAHSRRARSSEFRGIPS